MKRLLFPLIFILACPALRASDARIAFLGDSITYDGRWACLVESALRATPQFADADIVNFGLPSETVSGLSEEGHAGGEFPRPCLHERLERVLAGFEPTLVLACYGMNDGIYLPPEQTRFKAFQNGILELRSAVEKHGARIIFITPPLYQPGKSLDDPNRYDAVLDGYADWLVSRRATGWQVVDIRLSLKQAVAQAIAANPAFVYAGDGVHPGDDGHRFIAEAVCKQLWPLLDLPGSACFAEGPALQILRQRQDLLKKAWLSKTRHLRPGIPDGLPLDQAREKAAPLLVNYRAALAGDTFSDTWVATDALGRSVPTYAEVGAPRTNKFVGIFYFLWRDQVRAGPYDCTKIIAAGMQSGNTNYNTYNWGPQSAFHFWGEPYYGYYLDHDPYVLRRHAQMLADAGIDVLIFDVTNALTYENVYLALCQVFMQIRATGRTTPQIAFIAHSSSASTVTKLYTDFYSKAAYQQYQPLWFQWQGKPLILSSTNGLSATIRSFFTFRESWAWTGTTWFGDGRDKWPWLDHYPQGYGWHTNPATPEEMSVCIAQHPTSNIGRSSLTQVEPRIDYYFLPTNRALMNWGCCVTQQWSRALQVDPPFVFLTGWNEWIAQRFIQGTGGDTKFCGRTLQAGDTYFVDLFSQEYNRDIEPMRGGHGDNYYYQMVTYLRRFKGARPLPESSPPRTILLNSDFSQWTNVGPEYLDDLGDTAHRSFAGFGTGLTYTNTTGRNDLNAAKVAGDYKHLYFYARAVSSLTNPQASTNWMVLLLNTDGNPTNGWAGYDYMLNRVISAGTNGLRGSIERSLGGWNWQAAGEADLVTHSNQLHLAVQRSLLGLPVTNGLMTLDFKWADNLSNSGDPMEFMDRGDVAPNNRFNYRYQERVAPQANYPPVLAPISNQTVLAATTLLVTNSVTDADLPPQTLTFSLLSAPTNATINPASGVITWQPLIAQSPSTTQVQVRVEDDGSPSLSATQSFRVTVTRPPTPALGAPAWVGGRFQFAVSGHSGIWYTVWSSSNLLDWSQIGLTLPACTPFTFTDAFPLANEQCFYKVHIGP